MEGYVQGFTSVAVKKKVLKNFYDVIEFPSSDFALVLGEESFERR